MLPSISKLAWKKQNKFLDQSASINLQLKKQISKQTNMDSIIQSSINDKIYSLKVQATDLAKNLQGQKYINLQLQTIIKALKQKMQNDKKIQSQLVNDTTSQINLQSMQRKIKKLEYDLSQLNSRTNKVSQLITDRKQKISLLRIQRAIDSTIFKSIERQLAGFQLQFKKLLIQKIKNQKIYQNCLIQYNSLKNKAALYFQNQQQIKRNLNSQQNQQSQLQEVNHKNDPKHKFKQVIRNRSHLKNSNTQALDQKYKNQEKNIYYEFLIKKFLLNLNLNHHKEFIDLFNNIQNINQKHFKEIDEKSDQISRLIQQNNKIQQNIKENQIKFYQPQPQLTPNQITNKNCAALKKQIQGSKQSLNSQILQFKKLLNQEDFKCLTRNIQIPSNQNIQQLDFNIQSMLDCFKQIQNKMNNLTFYPPPPKIVDNNQSNLTKRSRIQSRIENQKEEKLQDLMNKAKGYGQTQRILQMQDFRQEYKKLIAGGYNGKLSQVKKTKHFII